MNMNQNKHNYQKDINLLIPNIDTTSERLSSDNRPGTFLKNTLTEKILKKPYQGHINTNGVENANLKYSNNLISKTMRNTPNNYNNNKEYQSSQKETQEMTHKKSSINSQKSLNKKLQNEKKSNYKDIIKKINLISTEKPNKVNIKNKIPLRPKKNISNINNYENKDSYIYIFKLKNNYSTDKLKEENSYYTNIQGNNNRNYKKNNNLTVNNFYPSKNNSKKTKRLNNIPKSVSINCIDNSNEKNRLNRNISSPYFNKMNIICSNINQLNKNNDFSEILNVRKKYNETYNNFYQNNHSQKKSNTKLIRNLTENNTFKKLKIKKQKSNNNIFHNNQTSDYSSINFYWDKRSKDTIQKMSQIKNELIQKEENEIQLIPKISQKSKELAKNTDKCKIEFNNIYDRLFYINNLNLNLNIDKENNNFNKINSDNQYHPKINKKSKKMARTIDDLYLWQNKRQKKIKENEENIFKKTVYNKKITNITSEVILKERRPNYIHKKVEDRLIEQGKNQKIKKEIEKEKCIHQLTEQRTYVNNNFNNIKSKYLEQKISNKNNYENNNDFDTNEKIEYNYYNIANMRNYDNFNKKLIYYGKNLNTNSFFYYNQLNKSLNSNQIQNQKTPVYSKSSDKIKCFDDNFYSRNNNISNICLKNNMDHNISNPNQRNNCPNLRIPKDFNYISRPLTSNNDNRQNKVKNLRNNFNISNLSTPQIIYDNNLSYKNNVNENKDNNIKIQSDKTSYYTLLYNDMINYNSKIINEINNNDNNKINKIEDLQLNLKINKNLDKNESSIKSYLSSLNNRSVEKIDKNKNKGENIDNKDINDNTGKFNYNEFPIINNINENNIEIKDNINLTENINTDSDIININGINNKQQKSNDIDYINNEKINKNTNSFSSSNTSKNDRRDRRKEDLMKIINFSDNLYNSQSK